MGHTAGNPAAIYRLACEGASTAFRTAERQQNPRVSRGFAPVTIDVIVADDNNQPVKNLTRDDFAVFENGKQQKISFFDVHSYTDERPYEPLPATPHVYSNFPDYDPRAPLNVIVLDRLNSETIDQAYVRQQMLKFLTKLPVNQPVELLVLSHNVTVIQGFTSSPEKLIEAATNLKITPSPLITTRNDIQATADAFATLRSQGSTNLAARLSQAMSMEEEFQSCQRQLYTIGGFEVIARMLSAYPGRKNLMWLSASFPLALREDSSYEGLCGANEVRRVSDLMTRSRIAVFPIDIKGLEVDPYWNAARGFTDFRRGQLLCAHDRAWRDQ